MEVRRQNGERQMLKSRSNDQGYHIYCRSVILKFSNIFKGTTPSNSIWNQMKNGLYSCYTKCKCVDCNKSSNISPFELEFKFGKAC